MSLTRCHPRLLRRRRAGVTLELILALPVLMIALLTVIEFGVILANMKQVAAASREGAKLAAETAALSPATTGAIASDVREAVDRRLASAGFGPGAARGVTLRHTVGGGGSATVPAPGDCSDPIVPALPDGAVRVTVCVELSRFSPDLLASFGFNLGGKVAEFTTTFDYEP